MQITASMVKELRELTGAGMMECKKALVEVDGDTQAAIDWMRKNGLAKADKKSSRVAAEGVAIIAMDQSKQHACLLEVNCETDFVARGDDFQTFVQHIAQLILAEQPADIAALSELTYATDSQLSVEEQRKTLVAKIGENIQIRRFHTLNTAGLLGSYTHGDRIAVLVDMEGGSDETAKDVAMHIAAMDPLCVSEEDIPAETIAREKDILVAQARQSGKPDNIIEKMVAGRLQKYLADKTLLGQPFVKDPDQTVAKLLKSAGASVNSFVRYAVGEGIEKEAANFADEVMAQVQAS